MDKWFMKLKLTTLSTSFPLFKKTSLYTWDQMEEQLFNGGVTHLKGKLAMLDGGKGYKLFVYMYFLFFVGRAYFIICQYNKCCFYSTCYL